MVLLYIIVYLIGCILAMIGVVKIDCKDHDITVELLILDLMCALFSWGTVVAVICDSIPLDKVIFKRKNISE